MIVNMVPAFDLTRQNRKFEKVYTEMFRDVILKGIFILGDKVSEFEKKFAGYIGVKHAIGVASGTDALTISLLALGIGEGDEVIMPVNSYPSAFGLAVTGAKLVLVDIDTKTYNIDSSKIEMAITKKTKAIVPVHLYGQPADMNMIMEIAAKYSIPVVEDCAQAVGGEIRMKQFYNDTMSQWKKVGSLGTIGCFSFYPTKNLGAFGDGGMIVTNNGELYKKVKLLRMYGERSRYESIVLGRNSRLDELQAAILLMKMKYLDLWIKRRREIAELYESRIMNYESRIIDIPKEREDIRHVYHLYVIRTKKRDGLKRYLERKGIQTAIHYPVPIHLVPSFSYSGYKKGDFPEAERASREILSLPIYPELRDHEIDKITRLIQQFFYDKTA